MSYYTVVALHFDNAVSDTRHIKIRKVIEIEPDAVAVTTRFQAEHTVIGKVEEACRELALRVEALQVKMSRRRAISEIIDDEDALLEKFSYMMHNNPKALDASAGHHRISSIPRILSDGVKSVMKDADLLWNTIHNGDVSSPNPDVCVALPALISSHTLFPRACSGAKSRR